MYSSSTSKRSSTQPCVGFLCVCRLRSTGELLNMLEGNGVKISDELARAVVQADDHTALKLLKKLGRQHE